MRQLNMYMYSSQEYMYMYSKYSTSQEKVTVFVLFHLVGAKWKRL